jgi:hypothetical protein
VFLTAAALSVMRWRQDYHLLAIGVVAFAAATVGYLHTAADGTASLAI